MAVIATRLGDAAGARRRALVHGVRAAVVAAIRRLRPRPPTPPAVRPPDPGVALASFIDDGERRDRQIVALREQAFGPDHPDVATALHILGARYHLVRRYDEAATLYERALAICTERLGHDHPSTVEVLEDLGDLWRDRGDAFSAQARYEFALTAVTDPERRRKKKDDYTARLARIGIGLEAGWPQRRTRP